MKKMPWPVAALAFEGVDTGREERLLEVGFARWRELDAPIESWSTFIRLELEWVDDADSPDLAAEPHVPRADPLIRLAAKDLCQHLTSELVGCTCTAYSSDRAWLTRLLQDTGTLPSFELRSLAEFQDATGQSLVAWLRRDRPVPRRAGPSAERLLRALAASLNCCPRFVVLP